MGLNANKGNVYNFIIRTTNIIYNPTLTSPIKRKNKSIKLSFNRVDVGAVSCLPIRTSTCNKNTALFSQNTSLFISMICSTYLIAVFTTTVIKIAYSNPNTNCTEAPFVMV